MNDPTRAVAARAAWPRAAPAPLGARAVANPYAPPRSNLEPRTATRPVKIASGPGQDRLGRVRFIAGSLGLLLAAAAIDALGGGVTLVMPQTLRELAWTVFVLLAYPSLIALGAMVTIQRLHDLDRGGWLAVLVFVPIANLLFLLALYALPGNTRANRHGRRPPPNSMAVTVCALALATLVAGLLALRQFGVAVPA